jgi:hypothetical protein
MNGIHKTLHEVLNIFYSYTYFSMEYSEKVEKISHEICIRKQNIAIQFS